MKTKFKYFIILLLLPKFIWSQAAATSNYDVQTGTLGSTYSWVDCSAGTTIVTGDDTTASFSWPFTFSYYDNTYTTSDNLSVATNGFIRLDGTADGGDYSAASSYSLTSNSTSLGQIIAMAVYDGYVGRNTSSSWVKYVVTGTAPNRILTIQYNNLEVPYSSSAYVNVQVSFYETLNKIVLKLGETTVSQSGVDMGLHSGVSGYFNKWQDLTSGTNNSWVEYTRTTSPPPLPNTSSAAASWNYGIQSGNTGTTYDWIDCSSGSSIVSGDDSEASINWPFNFNFYDNTYNISNTLSVATNGFIRLDGVANKSWDDSDIYDFNLTSSSTSLGQIIGLAVYDGKVGDNGGWVRSLVTGSSPNRIFTIEYNNLELAYSDKKYADVQVSFYESTNKIVLKLGTENIYREGVDMGLHSGINTFFDKWKEVNSGTNNTWVEYTPPYVEVNATIGTSVAYYSNLKTAFDKINDGTHRGIISIKINHSITESSSAILNASGSGSANYTSVTVYPTKTGISINGNIPAPLIDLNGADNVIIDGRVNASGGTKDLSIINTSTASYGSNSTLRFINDATNNTVKYCTIKGAETVSTTLNPSSGIIYFATGTNTGNDGNTIDNNNITSVDDASRPGFAIYSYGTTGKENTGITISNNEIYDVLKNDTTSNSIFLSSNTSACTITGNSFYETTSFSSNYAVEYNAILINNTSGNGFIISNNYIGGSEAFCGGTAWTKTNTTNNIFNAISLSVGTTTASSVQNNIIKNFNWSNSGNANWRGINVLAGNVNIGTVTGNIIGSATSTDSILVNGVGNGLSVYGINITSTGIVDCQKNTIGSITTTNGSTNASNIYGIYNSATVGTITISNNFIGSTTIANSLNASSLSTSNAQVVYGIYNAGSGVIAISNNSISNLINGSSNTAVGNLGVVQGITSIAGSNTISNNSIYNLSISNANTNALNNASVTGISLTGILNTKIVKGNTIYNLSNNYASFAGAVIGLYYGGSTIGTNSVSENFINSLSVHSSSTTASLYGIKIGSGNTTYSNNIISLGGNTKTTVYGIYETGISANNNSLYFNSVYIEGSLVSGSTNKSYALFSNVATNTRTIQNNIFMNTRSTVSGGNLHYAAYFNYTSSTNIVLNYNDYFVNGVGGVLGYWNNTNKTVLPIVTGQDANSLTNNPVFKTAGGTNFSDYIASGVLTGVDSSILLDYEGITRNSPPKIGALESSLPFVWQGNTSTDFATSTNWENGAVPPDGADIVFADTPTNDCYLDQTRTLRKITNVSSKKFVVNGKKLIITGSIASATLNQIDATANLSTIVFAGLTAQSIPSGVFEGNTIDGLTIDNSNGLTQNGDIIIQTQLTLANGTYTIGENTLTINNAITTTLGTLVGGSTSNISIGDSASVANTLLPSVTVNNLILNRANGITLGGNVAVTGSLSLTNGSLTLGSKTLTIATNTINKISGDIVANQTNDTVEFQNTLAYTLPLSFFNNNTIENFTISGAGGITLNENITLNGILNLQNANPSTTKGLLHVSLTDDATYNELVMGLNSTTDGQGDVTGVISRNVFVGSQTYTFGNKYTSAAFNPGATTLPTFFKVRVTIGTTPTWRTGAVNRSYDIIQEGGDNSIATFRAFYLDSELNGNEEGELSFWTPTDYQGDPPNVDSGRSNFDLNENWLELADVNISFFPEYFGIFPIVMDESGLSYKKWIGEYSTDWDNTLNWFPSGVPISTSTVRIPDATTTNYDPTLPPNVTTEIFKIVLELGSVLNSGSSDNAELILTDNIGTWSNNGGTFNPGNSTINFTRKNEVTNTPISGITTISGVTTFNNISISELTTLTMVANTTIKVAGAININEVGADRGVLSTAISGETTVDYNGDNQIVVVPDVSSKKYSTLILSGSGVKTMPAANLNIQSDLIMRGTATVSAMDSLTIGGEMNVESTATFVTGAYNHSVGGTLEIEGVFTASSGGTMTFNGEEEQLILGSDSINFDNLTINNTAGVKLFTNVAVNNTLELAKGNLNVDAVQLDINGGISKTSGFINVNLESSLGFGGTTPITLPSNLFFLDPSFKNLTINNTDGVVLGSDLTVNGVLNLQSANPSATIGSIDTGSFILNMGAIATTIGIGDVTGKVRRTTILPNIEYTFGNEFTGVLFPNIGTLPTEITLKIVIGSLPSWKADGVERVMDIAQVGGADTKAVIKLHYLDSELNGLNENNISLYSYVLPTTTLLERGRTELNTTNNWITLSNANFGNLPTVFGVIEHGIAISDTDIITWDGSESVDWYDENNWTPVFAPSSIKNVIIPDGSTTPNDPLITNNTTSTIQTIDIQPGAILNAGTATELIIVGTGGAWVNNGTFNASTGNVLFNHGVEGEIATIAGVTNFYNVEVGPNSTLQPVGGSTLRIENIGVADVTSFVDFSNIDNTVEWNGADQTVQNPIGIAGASGFYNLILSGSGVKTLPSTAMNILGDFSTSGTISVTALEALNISGNISIGTGTTFETGNLEHYIGGNFENNGTFIATVGNVITLNGTMAQSVLGTSNLNFQNLTINNIENVTQNTTVNIASLLTLNGGNLIIDNETLGINGTISNPSGAIKVGELSNLSFGGSSALQLNNNLFSSTPSLNNLTIDRVGGVTLGNQSITVNGLLNLPLGTLSIVDNTLTLAGNSPTRTSGNIDTSNVNSTMIFTNTSAITLPVSIFSGDVSNITVNGSGGVISNGDITLTGVLNLESNNPSTIKGSLDMFSPSIIDMGANATTIGIGDVTGIVQRAHTFLDGVEYSFGNKFTSLNFLNVSGGIKPTWVKCKISIGTAPTAWRSEAINRIYSFAQSGGTDRMIVKLHYLDNELHGTETDESQLVFWDAYDPDFGINNFVKFYPRNNNGTDGNNNWVQLTGPAINYIATSDLLDVKQWGLSYSDVTVHTWTGNGSPTYDGDWSLPGNWNGGVPNKGNAISIPNPSTLPTDNNGDLYPYTNLLPIIAPSEVKTLEIESGATLSATDYDITVYGDTDAWVNNGTFIPGNATVIFAHGDPENAVTLSGTTNFYNVSINDKTMIQPATSSIIKIENTFNFESGSVLDFTTNNNTIDYNGTDQTVIHPLGGSTGYYNLSLSGSGLKTLPNDTFQIIGNFDMYENASTLVKSNLTIGTNLNLSDTSNLSIAASRTFTVNGIITNLVGNEGFVLKSSVVGTASLIHNTDNVPATMERYISGTKEAWHFLSSPVSNQTIAGSNWVPSGTYGNGTGYDMYVWDESTPCWVYHDGSSTPSWNTIHPQTDFISARGYLYSAQAENPTNEFKGLLNNGTISYAVTANSTVDPLLIGFNLIGNPYPSSIDWKASAGWTRNNLIDSGGGKDMWIWNPAANNYGVFNSVGTVGTNDVTQYIAPMQGFFVRAETNANIVMDNTIRLHDGANNWMKSSDFKNNISNLKVQIASDSGLGFDEILLQFGSSSNQSGAAKLYSTSKTAPSTYIKNGNEELSVKHLTNVIDNPLVPIFFKPGKEGSYKFNIDLEYNYFDYVILEDKKENTFHDLIENPIYKFKASLDDDFDRFVLHFTPQESDSTIEELFTPIYYNGDHVIVDLTSIIGNTDIQIYDMLGKLLLQTKVSGGHIHKLSVSKTNQVLIVIATNDQKSINKKIVVY